MDYKLWKLKVGKMIRQAEIDEVNATKTYKKRAEILSEMVSKDKENSEYLTLFSDEMDTHSSDESCHKKLIEQLKKSLVFIGIPGTELDEKEIKFNYKDENIIEIIKNSLEEEYNAYYHYDKLISELEIAKNNSGEKDKKNFEEIIKDFISIRDKEKEHNEDIQNIYSLLPSKYQPEKEIELKKL